MSESIVCPLCGQHTYSGHSCAAYRPHSSTTFTPNSTVYSAGELEFPEIKSVWKVELIPYEAVEKRDKRIAELEQQLAELREAAQEIVGWDWVNLKGEPYHVDWFEALVDVGLLEKLLQESEDVV